MLERPDAASHMNKVMVDRIVPHIKQAMSIESRFEAGLNALEQLSNVVHMDLNPHLKGLMQQLSKKCSNKKYKDRIMDVLFTLEQNGGKEALLAIKSKIPTYTPMVG